MKKEINDLYKEVDIITITFDFNKWGFEGEKCREDDQTYQKLSEAIEDIIKSGKDISVLVNNVGTMVVAPYDKQSHEDMGSMIKVNILS